jgi:benzoate-CoA ligase family protein
MAVVIEPNHAVSASELGVPETFNLATYLVDRHIDEGRGDSIAIVCGDEEVSYRQIQQRANKLANTLRALGVNREQRVMLLMLDTPEFIYGFIGAMKIAAVPIPTNTLLKPADYEYMLNDSRASVVIVSSQLLPAIDAIPRERLPFLRDVIVAGDSPAGMLSLQALLDQEPDELDVEQTSRDDVAFWLYSSGTTGFPKGAVHLHHDAVLTAVLYARGVLEMTDKDRTFSVAKLFFAYGLGNALTFPFAVGATTILFPGPPTAQNVFAQIERYKPTLLFSVPTNYGMLLATEPETGSAFDLSSVRQGVSAGEALPRALFERFQNRFGVEILDGIGSTEALHIFISNRSGRVRPGSSGEIVPGYLARIVDDEGRDVAHDEVGNLLVRGDSVCAGYWNKHERTKDTIEGHWIRTGDKYSQDADGYFWYAGRTDDMLKVGGIWVSPVEIENTLIEHPAVLEAGVIGREDQDELVKPHASVVLNSGYKGSDALTAELQDFVRQRIAEYKRPRWIEFVTELPKTATGKTQRFKLRERAG